MHFKQLPLNGAYLIDPDPFKDERGFFARTFCQKKFAEIGFHKQIVQINHSATRLKGSIRGMHYQRPPASETKIVRCVQGAVFDVMVDLRADSTTFMRWHGVELSQKNMCMVYIPDGFAHGFQTLTDNADLIYHHSAFYNPEYEHGFRYDDPAVSITWPLSVSEISQRDINHPFLCGDFGGIEL